MKNLLLILALFVVGCSKSVERTSLKCEFYKVCEENECSENVQKSFVQVTYDDEEVLVGDMLYRIGVLFTEDYIKFGIPDREYMTKYFLDEEYPIYKRWQKDLGVYTLYTKALLLNKEFESPFPMRAEFHPSGKIQKYSNNYICEEIK